MIQGKKVNLRIADRDDVETLLSWFNDHDFAGEYQNYPSQVTSHALEKRISEHKNYENEWVDFIIENKRGEETGWAVHFISAPNFGWTEIGYSILKAHRNKGYATEAVRLLVDYLFLTREIIRIQATVDLDNEASKRVVEKSGFLFEGRLRKALWNAHGEWTDGLLYSVFRGDWDGPKVIIKAERTSKNKMKSK